ncbi:hypothetical protein THAOC_25175, partial [Thalassiosira oceanica]
MRDLRQDRLVAVGLSAASAVTPAGASARFRIGMVRKRALSSGRKSERAGRARKQSQRTRRDTRWGKSTPLAERKQKQPDELRVEVAWMDYGPGLPRTHRTPANTGNEEQNRPGGVMTKNDTGELEEDVEVELALASLASADSADSAGREEGAPPVCLGSRATSKGFFRIGVAVASTIAVLAAIILIATLPA